MKVDAEQYDKARDFVMDTLQEGQRKFDSSKKALEWFTEQLDEEFKRSKNVEYIKSLMYLAHEISESITEFAENQSQ